MVFLPYVIIFCISAFFVFNPLSFKEKFNDKIILFFIFFLTLFVGSRVEIGGDWGTYLYNYYTNGENFDFFDFSIRSDWGFETLSYLFYYYDLPATYFLFFCSIINFCCLYIFLNKQPNKWLFLTISFPYLITVIYMGFVRQSLALSFMFLAINSSNENKTTKVLYYFILGFLFHKSSIIIFLLILICNKNIFKQIFSTKVFLLIILISYLIYYSSSDFSNLIGVYIEDPRGLSLSSKGAIPRLLLSFTAVIIFFIYKHKFKFTDFENKFYTANSFLIIFLCLFVFKYSTLVDRLNIYCLPFQLVVFSRLFLIDSTLIVKNLLNLTSVFIYGMIFVIWLYFSNSSHRWAPYYSFLLGHKMPIYYFMNYSINCDMYFQGDLFDKNEIDCNNIKKASNFEQE